MLNQGETAPAPAATAAPTRRGRPFIAWAVILVAAAVPVALHALRPVLAKENPPDDRMGEILLQMQARQLVGLTAIFGRTSTGLSAAANPLNTGPVPQRLRFVVLAGELDGPEGALERLRQLDEKLDARGFSYTPKQVELRDALRELYQDYAQERWHAPSLTPPRREELRAELGWFGELALAPAGGPDTAARAAVLAPAQRAAVSWLVILAVGAFLCLLGAIGLITLVVLLATGHVHLRLATGSPNGGVYAETFAVWIVLFLVFSAAGAILPITEGRLWISSAFGLLSLLALAWPVARGVPWRQVRREVGLTLGRRPWLEPLVGLGCYVISLPLLVVAALAASALVRWQAHWEQAPEDYFGPNRLPAHPIMEDLAHSNWLGLVQIAFLASVLAPLLEETLFRGVLHRQLREATSRWGRVLSILASATVAGLLFAVIHPYGLAGVPVLMALAYGFSLAREWRGTLIPGMVAHGLHNLLITVFFLSSMAG